MYKISWSMKCNAALEAMTDLGLSRDQSLLALIHAAWDVQKAADACIDHVYAVTARRRPPVTLCHNECGNFAVGDKILCCVSCTSTTGPHTRHCKKAQVERRAQHAGVLGDPEPEGKRAAAPSGKGKKAAASS